MSAISRDRPKRFDRVDYLCLWGKKSLVSMWKNVKFKKKKKREINPNDKQWWLNILMLTLTLITNKLPLIYIKWHYFKTFFFFLVIYYYVDNSIIAFNILFNIFQMKLSWGSGLNWLNDLKIVLPVYYK